MKGGYTSGSYSQIIPRDKINLHFTGDCYDITSANNLPSAVNYNYIYQDYYLNDLVHTGLSIAVKSLQ